MWRLRLAMLLLSAATAALGSGRSEPPNREPPFIGAMTVTATRLPAEQPSSGAMLAGAHPRTPDAQYEGAPRGEGAHAISGVRI